mmetsp:Transcript_13137/g.28799  ORF Transcript_13137/g.28799 Transcript_13137/m.28799 type:complete len:1577 (-) Transcript_13137:39-4769(-)
MTMATTHLDYHWKSEKMAAERSSPSEHALAPGSTKNQPHTESNAPQDNSELHSIMQSVTLSEDEDDDNALSPLSKLYAETSPLSLGPNSSYIAMMERYLDVEQFVESDREDYNDDDVGPEETEASQPKMKALAAVVNISTSNEKFNTSHQTPTKDTTTPKRYFRDWSEEGQTFTPRSILKQAIIPSDDEEEEEGSSVDGGNSPSDLSPSPTSPLSASPFSTFKNNASHIALDETKVYLRKIQELQNALQSAEDRAKEETRRREAAENRCDELKLQMATLSPMKSPATNKSETPRTPMSDSLWERNKTLVKEVRFADQTCVELSGQKVALEKQINQLEDQLSSSQEQNTMLQSQILEQSRAHAETAAQCKVAQTRLEELECKLLKANESLARMESAQNTLESSVLPKGENRDLSPSRRAEHLLKVIREKEESSMQVLDLRNQLNKEASKRADMVLEHETEKLQLRDELAKQRTDFNVSQATIASLLSEKQMGESELVKAEAEVSNLQRKIKEADDELNKERERHGTELASQTSKLKEAKCQFDEVTQELSSTKEQLNQAQIELDNLTGSNTKLLELQQNQSDNAEEHVTELRSRIRVLEKNLVQTETVLAQERKLARTKDIEIEKEIESNLLQAQEQMELIARDLAQVHQREIEDMDEQFKKRVAELKGSIRELQRQRDESKSSEENTRTSLSLAVDSLKRDRTKLACELQESKRAMALELEQMSIIIEEKRQKLESAEGDISKLKAASQNSARILAGSIKAAAGEFQRESDAVENSVEEFAANLMSRLSSLSTRIHNLENNTSCVAANSMAAEPSDRDHSVPETDSLAPYSLSQVLTSPNTAPHSTTSRLLGASILSPSPVNESELPIETPLPTHEALNITQDLERMEEARELDHDFSTNVSSIQGLSHLFNGSFMSKDDSPRKRPDVTSNNNMNEKLLRVETERDDLLARIQLLRQQHDQLKEKATQLDEIEIKLRRVQDENESIATLLSEAQTIASKEREQRIELEKDSDEVSAQKADYEISMVAMRHKVARVEEEMKNLRSERNRFSGLFDEVISAMNMEAGKFEFIDLPSKVSEMRDELVALRSTSNSTDLAMKDLTEECDSFRNMSAQQAAKIEELEASIEALKQELGKEKDRAAHSRDLVEENAGLATKVRTAANQVDKLNETLELETERSKQLTQEVQELRTSLGNSDSRCHDIENELHAKCVEAELLGLKFKAISEEVEMAKHARDDLQHQLRTCQAEYGELKNAEILLHEQLDSRNHLIAELQDDLQSRTSESNDLMLARARVARLEVDVEESQDETNRLKEALLKCNERLSENSDIQNGLLNEIETFKETQAVAHTSTLALRHEATEAKNALVRKQLNNEAMIRQLEHATQQLEGMIQRATSLSSGFVNEACSETEDNSGDSIFGALDAKLQYFSQFLELWKEDKLQLEVVHKDLQKELCEKDSIVVEKSQLVEKLELKCRRLKEYAKKLASKCDEWEDFYTQNCVLVEELQAENEQSRKQSLQLEQQCAEKDKLHRRQEVEWSVERDEFFNVQHHYEAELEALARELLIGDDNSKPLPLMQQVSE